MNIGLVTFAKPKNYASRVRPGVLSKKAYCTHQGYPLLKDVQDVFDATRPPSWSKILLLLKHMDKNRFDWLFWTDGDTLIKNQDKKLEDLLAETGIKDNQDFVFTRDPRGTINLGNFFVRVTDSAKDFLNRLYKMDRFIDHPWFEQGALIWMYQRNQYGIMAKSHIEHRPWKFNACPVEIHTKYSAAKRVPEIAVYRTGDFLIHFAGAKDKGLKTWMYKYSLPDYKDPMPKRDETDWEKSYKWRFELTSLPE